MHTEIQRRATVITPTKVSGYTECGGAEAGL
jgi:hypothetical protein